MALTATASSRTQHVIQDSLCMYNCYTIIKIPNKHNIKYSVRLKPDQLLDAFMPIVNGLQKKGRDADKYIIFCRSYDDTVKVHECIADELGQVAMVSCLLMAILPVNCSQVQHM